MNGNPEIFIDFIRFFKKDFTVPMTLQGFFFATVFAQNVSRLLIVINIYRTSTVPILYHTTDIAVLPLSFCFSLYSTLSSLRVLGTATTKIITAREA
jgi:hypothetical protein